MKKILYFIIANVFAVGAISAQCTTNEEAHNIPTICKKEYSTSYMPTKEQEKWMTSFYSTIVEPAIKKTKGLQGKWKPMGNFPITPEGNVKSDIAMFVNLLTCTKEHKLTERDEQGLILNFISNAFTDVVTTEIAPACEHQEDKISNGKNNTIYVKDLMEGKQIYTLEKRTKTGKYKNLSFYRETGDGKYFVIAKPDSLLFIPLTVKQALEVNKKNIESRLKNLNLSLSLPDYKMETRAEYEKRMAKDFAAYRASFPDPEKFIIDLIKTLDETKLAAIKGIQFQIDFNTKSLGIITDYLNTASSKELSKPCISYFDFLAGSFENKSQIKSSLLDDPLEKMYVILNPVYFNHKISKAAPQFISVELRAQGNAPTTQKAFDDFETNIDFSKLQQLLVK